MNRDRRRRGMKVFAKILLSTATFLYSLDTLYNLRCETVVTGFDQCVWHDFVELSMGAAHHLSFKKL